VPWQTSGLCAELQDPNAMNSFRGYKLILLAILPVIFVVLAARYTVLRGPLHLASNNDPSYVYLSNGLLLLDGRVPYHTDHPGTPLQVLCAVSVAVQNLPGGLETAINHALEDPEDALGRITYVLLFLSFIGLCLTGFALYRATGSVWLALLVQASPLLLPECLQSFRRVAPEPFLLGITFIYGALILWRGSDLVRLGTSRIPLWLIAALAGLGLAAKITFLPLCLLGLFPWQGLRKMLLYFCFLLGSCLLCLLPIIAALPRVFSWLVTLSSHTGQYGGGPKGVFAPDLFWSSVRSLLDAVQVWPVLWGVSLFATLLIASVRPTKNKYRMACWVAATLIVQLMSLVMVAKHPSPHYLHPALASITLLVGTVVILIKDSLKQWPAIAGLSVLLLAFVASSPMALKSGKASFERTENETAHHLGFLKRVREIAGTNMTLDYYSSSSIPYALQFANGWAYQHFSKRLHELYPDYVCFNIFNGHYSAFASSIEDSATLFKDAKSVYFYGTDDLMPLIKDGRLKLPAGWKLELALNEQHSFLFKASRNAAKEL
jgi:hypothetical protein